MATLIGCATDSTPAVAPTATAAEMPWPTPTPTADPVTMAQVLNASLPSICDFDAGQLTNGVLVTGEMDGSPIGVSVVEGRVVFGVLDGTNSDGDAAAVLSCDHGGVAWPQLVALVTTGGKVLGVQNLMDITGQGQESVNDLRFENGGVRVEWFTKTADDQPAAFKPGSASAVLRWDGTKIVVDDLSVRGVADAWHDLIAALKAGDTAAIESLVSPSLLAVGSVDYLLDPFVGEECSEQVDPDAMAAGWCTLSYADPGGYVGLSWTMTGWNTWQLDSVSSSWQ